VTAVNLGAGTATESKLAVVLKMSVDNRAVEVKLRCLTDVPQPILRTHHLLAVDDICGQQLAWQLIVLEDDEHLHSDRLLFRENRTVRVELVPLNDKNPFDLSALRAVPLLRLKVAPSWS
jgi:hypothetical protein